MSVLNGLTRVTQSALRIKDRTVLPPDRVIFTYLIWDREKGGQNTKEVIGNWGDYLRDLDNKLVVENLTTPTQGHNPDGVMIVEDLYGGIPDKTSIPNPMLPY